MTKGELHDSFLIDMHGHKDPGELHVATHVNYLAINCLLNHYYRGPFTGPQLHKLAAK